MVAAAGTLTAVDDLRIGLAVLTVTVALLRREGWCTGGPPHR